MAPTVIKNQPQLTPVVPPQSAIAPSVRAALLVKNAKISDNMTMSMMVSMPIPTNVTAIVSPSSSQSPPLLREDLTSTSSAPKTPEFVKNADDGAPDMVQRPKNQSATPVQSKTSVIIAALPTPLPAISAPSTAYPRGSGSQLPSRGGLVINPKVIELRPQPVAPDTTPVSDEERLLLARLDADLGRAQTRLNRAESRLSEGQKQLAEFTDALRSAMLDAGEDAHGLHPFVRVAQRYLGTPYVWGGESARGFDCSGFIMRVMRDLGYRALPHSAAEQFRYGLPIAKPLLKPGDVVFFANTYKPGISHVGIYLGRGRFIHAANSHVGTIVSSLNEPKWVEKYAGARRLLPVKS